MEHLLHDPLSTFDKLTHALSKRAPVSEWVSSKNHRICTEELQALVGDREWVTFQFLKIRTPENVFLGCRGLPDDGANVLCQSPRGEGFRKIT